MNGILFLRESPRLNKVIICLSNEVSSHEMASACLSSLSDTGLTHSVLDSEDIIISLKASCLMAISSIEISLQKVSKTIWLCILTVFQYIK